MSRIRPELLEPYLGLPSEAAVLIVLTGILNATPNWLLFRYLHSFLKDPSHFPSLPRQKQQQQEEEEPPAVLLVSFLRDFAFYQEGLGKLGLDLEGSSKKGRFVFVDGLSSLFLDGGKNQVQQQQQQQQWKKIIVGSKVEDIRRVILEGVEGLRKRAAKQRKVVLVLDGMGFLVSALASAPEAHTAEIMRNLVLELRQWTQ